MDVRYGGRGHHRFLWREIVESCGHRNGCALLVWSQLTQFSKSQGAIQGEQSRAELVVLSLHASKEQFTINSPTLNVCFVLLCAMGDGSLMVGKQVVICSK